MAITRPVDLPKWATIATGTDITEPDEAKKIRGFGKVGGVPEKPPYQDFNWWMNLVYEWLKYYSDLESRQIGVNGPQSSWASLGSISLSSSIYSAVKFTIVVANASIQSFIEVYAVSDGTAWTHVNWVEPVGSAASTFEFRFNGDDFEYKNALASDTVVNVSTIQKFGAFL